MGAETGTPYEEMVRHWTELKDGWYRYVLPVYPGPEDSPTDHGTRYLMWAEFLTVKNP